MGQALLQLHTQKQGSQLGVCSQHYVTGCRQRVVIKRAVHDVLSTMVGGTENEKQQVPAKAKHEVQWIDIECRD